jgi:hypothetical protein
MYDNGSGASLPVTGGLVIFGHAVGMGWIASAAVGIVIVGVALVLAARHSRRRNHGGA